MTMGRQKSDDEGKKEEKLKVVEKEETCSIFANPANLPSRHKILSCPPPSLRCILHHIFSGTGLAVIGQCFIGIYSTRAIVINQFKLQRLH
jgi:hypothetical protein